MYVQVLKFESYGMQVTWYLVSQIWIIDIVVNSINEAMFNINIGFVEERIPLI
jgi:hypothetical protein